MIAATSEKGKRIALFGLGGSGLATARSLKAGGADLVCYDDNPERVLAAEAEGLKTQDLRDVEFANVDELLLSPGVPLTHPKPHWTVEKANASNVAIIGDVELFSRERNAKAPECAFVAITGTNGKSTTTALISHVFASAGKDIQMGGNIGTAILSLDELSDEKVYVVECSSYQIDLAPSLSPQVGILLNLAPDHLDRHGDMKNYAEIKKRLVDASDHAVIGVDDAFSIEVAADIEAAGKNLIRISGKSVVENGIGFDGRNLIESKDGVSRILSDLSKATALRGAHNAQNAAATWAACSLSGLNDNEIVAGFESFPGLAHRMEPVGKIGRALIVNDSKGTNADAAAKALSSFERIYWIAGGLAKEGGIETLRAYFPKIAKAYFIGEAAPEFAATLGSDAPFEISNTLDNAVARACEDIASDTHDEPVVLLSPACASFDQYPNFEVRGDAFRGLVQTIDGFVPREETSL